MMRKKILFCCLFLSSCAVGPDYVRPTAPVPVAFKEAPKGWKMADPRDAFDRGQWWKIFHDPQLNALEEKLTISNQTIATSKAQYEQALAVIDEARAGYFPTILGSLSVTRQKQGSFSTTSASTSSSGTTSAGSASTGTATTGSGSSSISSAPAFTSESLLLNASWEPDLWGNVRRTVEANTGSAESFSALLAAARLSAEASLAQFYFELRAVDLDLKILNNTVADYKKALVLTQNQYRSGVVGQTDIIQARSQLESAQALAINAKINRGQYEHAIAVLIGVPPAELSLKFAPLTAKPPKIPLEVPSVLLERRPDIASAERLVSQANAQIGVAISAYFPTVTLSASLSALGRASIGNWLSAPVFGWSLGPTIAETFYDGGLRSATVKAARANYRATVATYRQTVLAAFQDVEDNLVSLRTLNTQAIYNHKAAYDAKLALKLVMNQYKAGTVPYANVLTAQIAAFTAEKTAADVDGLRMTSAVGLIKALGGGWQESSPPF